jgi:hypothetical protein
MISENTPGMIYTPSNMLVPAISEYKNDLKFRSNLLNKQEKSQQCKEEEGKRKRYTNGITEEAY